MHIIYFMYNWDASLRVACCGSIVLTLTVPRLYPDVLALPAEVADYGNAFAVRHPFGPQGLPYCLLKEGSYAKL